MKNVLTNEREMDVASSASLSGVGVSSPPAPVSLEELLLESELVTNSILFCWLLTIKDRWKKVRFQQTHYQGLRRLLLTVSWDLRAKQGTPDGVLVSL